MEHRFEALVARLLARGETVSTAESCTGGLLGKCITDVSGSSAVYPGGVVSYASRVKHSVLGVSAEDLERLGPVSAPVACQMAEGVRRVIGADYGIGVTGLAGPNGDGSGKPVGLVYISVSDGIRSVVREFHFAGTRSLIRAQACEAAAELLGEWLDEPQTSDR